MLKLRGQLDAIAQVRVCDLRSRLLLVASLGGPGWLLSSRCSSCAASWVLQELLQGIYHC